MKSNVGKIIGLISIIISLLVGAILLVTSINIYTGGRNQGAESVTAPIERAKSVECLSQIRKIEMAIQIYYVENTRYPERLEGITDLSNQDLYCPLTQKPYNYEPTTGRVRCPDHTK